MKKVYIHTKKKFVYQKTEVLVSITTAIRILSNSQCKRLTMPDKIEGMKASFYNSLLVNVNGGMNHGW